MEATVRIFDDDAYKTTMNANVLTCNAIEKEGGECYEVILDRTIFFPEGGGQSPDRGTISGEKVLDVQINGDVITHTLEVPIPAGREVECRLDWKHRFSNMQQHSGEHIFSGLVHEKYGYHNVGFHLSDQIVTMDFSGGLTEAQVEALELEVNQCIAADIPFQVTYPSKRELEALEYRSKIEIDGQVRIVTVPGFDVCACCGTHVRHSGEIGVFKVVNTQNYKGGIRISLLCGFRALDDYKKKQQSVVSISNMLSVRQEEVADAVEKLKRDTTVLRQQLNAVKESLVVQKVLQIDNSLEHVCVFETDLDSDAMRAAVNALTDIHSGFCAVFSGDDENGYRYIVGSKEMDAREIGNLLREKFAAKGGGKPSMIQGSVRATQEEIKELF